MKEENAIHEEKHTSIAEENEIKKINNKLEIYSKFIALTIGSLYGIGILIVNTYQYELGISEFSIIDLKYIYAGTLFFFFSMFFLFIPVLTLSNRILHVQKTSTLPRKIFEAFRFIILAIGPLVICLLFIAFNRRANSIFINDSSYFLVVIMQIASFPFIYYLIKIIKELNLLSLEIDVPKFRVNYGIFSRTLEEYLKIKWFKIVMLSKTCILFFGIYLMAFSLSIYSTMPEQFGGGKPKPMILNFNQEDCKQLSKEIRIDPMNCNSEQLYIVYETEEYLIIREKFDSVIKIKRDKVNSITIKDYLKY